MGQPRQLMFSFFFTLSVSPQQRGTSERAYIAGLRKTSVLQIQGFGFGDCNMGFGKNYALQISLHAERDHLAESLMEGPVASPKKKKKHLPWPAFFVLRPEPLFTEVSKTSGPEIRKGLRKDLCGGLHTH